MTEHNVVPDDIFTALARGDGGERAMRFLVRTQRNKHQLLLRLVVATAARVGDSRARDLTASYQLLADLQTDHPLVVERLLRYPPIGVWAMQALRDLLSGAVADHGYLNALAASAALLTRADCTVTVPVDQGRVFLPSLGCADLTSLDAIATAQVCSSQAGGEIRVGGAQIPIPANRCNDSHSWRSIRRLHTGNAPMTWNFLLDDLDPYRLPAGHIPSRLDTAALREWRRTVDDAWALLVAQHPETVDEIASAVTVLVPLQAPDGRQVSATSRHSFGTVALSRPSNSLSFAVTLAHERQHSKLNALLDLVALIDDPGQTRWFAPWREDSRPLAALLQGAYAHLGVAAFWRRQRHVERGGSALRAQAEFTRWRDGTRKVVSALRTSGAATEAGIRFIDGMTAVLDTWREEPDPTAMIEQATPSQQQPTGSPGTG